MKGPLTTEKGCEMENFIVKYHSVLFSIIIAFFLLACAAMASAEEGAIIAESVCEYKKTHYEWQGSGHQREQVVRSLLQNYIILGNITT